MAHLLALQSRLSCRTVWPNRSLKCETVVTSPTEVTVTLPDTQQHAVNKQLYLVQGCQEHPPTKRPVPAYTRYMTNREGICYFMLSGTARFAGYKSDHKLHLIALQYCQTNVCRITCWMQLFIKILCLTLGPTTAAHLHNLSHQSTL